MEGREMRGCRGEEAQDPAKDERARAWRWGQSPSKAWLQLRTGQPTVAGGDSRPNFNRAGVSTGTLPASPSQGYS